MPERSDEAPFSSTSDGDDAGFLSRWSRRKTQARQGHPPLAGTTEDARPGQGLEPTPGEARLHGTTATAAEPEPVADPILTDADMPPLDSLGPDSDYSGFLSPRVSKDLRRQALARLFRGAAFNVTDGLDDYAEDFTQFTPLGDLVTADMRYRLERELEQKARRLADAAPGTSDRPVETETDDARGPERADAHAGPAALPIDQSADRPPKQPAEQPAAPWNAKDDAEPSPRAAVERPSSQPTAAGST
jgi:hypothetical protein